MEKNTESLKKEIDRLNKKIERLERYRTNGWDVINDNFADIAFVVAIAIVFGALVLVEV